MLALALAAAAAGRADAEVGWGINDALAHAVVITDNHVHASGEGVATSVQLQTLLDANPNTAFYLRRTRIEIVADGNRTGLTLAGNRSLVMDAASEIFCTTALPPPGNIPPSDAKYGPHLILLTGTNVGIRGGRVTQHTAPGSSQKPDNSVGIRLLDASDAKVSQVTLSGSWGQAIRVMGNDGATAPPFGSCPSYYTAGCQAPQLPFQQGLNFSSQLALSELMTMGLVRPPVVLLNNTIVASARAERAIWLTWSVGVIVAGNVIRGPYHYGIDLDAMASQCVITGNDVRGSLYAALFIEMQCLHNLVTGTTLVANGSYALNLNSFLNFVVLNDLGGGEAKSGGLKISGTSPYPVALSVRTALSYSSSFRIP